MHDMQHQGFAHQLSELEHAYGPKVHILADPYLLSLLSRLCAPETFQPDINRLVEVIYRHLTGLVAAHELPRTTVRRPTRMSAYHPEAAYSGEVIDPHSKAVVVDIARAGMFPSQIVYDHLNLILDPQGVRQDHVFMNRRTDETGAVVGVDVSGSKLGGPVEDAILLIPDPMGATGGSIRHAIELMATHGRARKVIAMHLIVTPEYIKAMQAHHPDAIIYAVRLDRGLSAPHVLNSVPGTLWAEERGLNDRQYIVPGGGGFGEILNNAFV